MEIGFETIGNATLICYDRKPILATDPWIQGSAYFGSWRLANVVPDEQRAAILACPYVWFSHGHPDHLNPECLPLFKGKEILLPDHYGGRIRQDLEKEGFSVRVLADRKWVSLSDRIRILCLSDVFQDAVLLIDIDGKLIINTNDAIDFGRDVFIRKLAKGYPVSFLTSIGGYPGESDFMNFFDEQGRFVPCPLPAAQEPIGPGLARKTERFGAKYFVPFACFHTFQRTDSVWIRKYNSTVADFAKGFESQTAQILPPFLRYDCAADRLSELNPPATTGAPRPPSDFGDDWSVPLEASDVAAAERYFRSFSHLETFLDFVTLRVGGKDHPITLGRKDFRRGITIEAPRHSLMRGIGYEIFEDVLIGNFARVTLHGEWPETKLQPDFTPYVAKYGDNGRAKSPAELAAYFKAYERREIFGWWHLVQKKLAPSLRRHLRRDGLFYQLARQTYRELSRKFG